VNAAPASIGSTPSNSRNVSWNAAAGIASIAGNILLFPVALNYMGAPTYGVWLLCFTATTLLTQADAGLGTAIVRQVSHAISRGDEPSEAALKRVSLSLFIGLALALPAAQLLGLMAFFSSAHATSSDPDLPEFLIISTVTLFVGVLGRYFTAVLQAHRRFDIERMALVGSMVVRVSVLLLVVALGLPVWAAAISECLTVALPASTAALVAWRRRFIGRGLAGRDDWTLVGPDLLRFSLPVFASAFASQLALQLPVYFVAALLNTSSVAAYTAAVRIYQTMRTVYGWITGPALPVASTLHAENRLDSIGELHLKLISVCASIGAVAGSVMYFQGENLLAVWLGDDFRVHAAAVEIFALAVVAFSVYSPGVVLAAACGRPGVVAFGNVVWCVATVAIVYPSASAWGIEGASAAAVLPLLALSPLLFWLPARVTRLRIGRSLIPIFGIPVLAGLFGAATSSLVSQWGLHAFVEISAVGFGSGLGVVIFFLIGRRVSARKVVEA
jgi:O-antigen/teichoic acid export membrane protein